jgi:hypothetical protein
MNRELFLLQKSRIDDRKFFIRNAVKSPEDWKHKNKHILAADIADFKRLVDEHQPFMILTFGQRAFEFACRSQGENAQPFSYWEVAKLSGEFDARLSCIRDGKGYYYLRAGDTLNLVTHVATLLPHAPDPWDNPAKLAAGRAGFVCGVLRITAGHEHGDHREGRSIGEPTGAAAEGPVVRQVGGEFAVKVDEKPGAGHLLLDAKQSKSMFHRCRDTIRVLFESKAYGLRESLLNTLKEDQFRSRN